jgi:serine protease Do
VRGDKDIIELSKEFVLLRFTMMRDVNIGLFAYDFDMTWMSFFLDADGHIYTRYGSRDSASSDGRITAAGLLHTMREVLALHRLELAQPRPPAELPRAMKPRDIPAFNRLYGGSCGRCHMLNEAKWEQQRADSTMKPGPFFLYPLPDNVGIKLDLTECNRIKEIVKDSFAAKAGLQPNDKVLFANGTRVLTTADLQFVLNGLEPESQLTLEVERAGKPTTAVLQLEGSWRASDVSWRKSIKVRAFRNDFIRFLTPLQPAEKTRLGIDKDHLAFRLQDSKAEAQEAGLRKDDIVVAFDGKRSIPYRNPQYYPMIDHKAGDKMEVTVLRDGKEQAFTLRVP